MSTIRSFILNHKIITGIIVVVLVGGTYFYYSSSSSTATVTKYVIEKASQATVIASVQGSGQVEAQTSIDIKPQVTETVAKVYVQPGDHVAAGQLLVQLDPTNEQKSLKQAQLSLQSAQISLAKLQEAPATTTLGQAQDAVTQAGEQLDQASATLQKDYQESFDTIAASFIDLQNVITGLQNFVQNNDVNKGQSNPDAYVNLMPNYLTQSALPYRDNVYSEFSAVTAAYQQNLVDFHAASRNSGESTLDALLNETYNTAKTLSDAVKAAKDLLNFVVNNYPSSSSTLALPPVTNTFQANFGNYTNTVSGDVGNLLNQENTISSDKTAIDAAGRSLKEKQDSLTALLAGPDALDVQSQGLSIQQQELALQGAEQNLSYTSIRAPIDGVVSAVGATVGETVASPAVSIVGSSKEAAVTLNEVDAAKVNLGDKATLAFDALPNLSLAGQVVEVDPVGTVSQGVVNYNVKISFASAGTSTSTDQVKPGMSVTANIVTQVDQNVIAVPNAAILTAGGSKYVLAPASPVSDADLASSTAQNGIELAAAPVRIQVTVGIANSTMTEITSGLNVGDQYVARTITGVSAASSASGGGTNVFRALGGGGFGGGAGGGAVRVGGTAAGR